MSMQEMIDRLEKARSPSRVLDFEVHLAAVGDPLWPATDMRGRITNPNTRMSDYVRIYRDVIDADDQDFDFPRYTSSIDAALTLVPSFGQYGEGQWHLSRLGYDDGVYQRGKSGADIHHPLSSGGGPRWKGFGATPAIALCIAALRARSDELAKAQGGPDGAQR